MSRDIPEVLQTPTRRQLVLAAIALAAVPLVSACSAGALTEPEQPTRSTPPSPADDTVIVRTREIEVRVARIPELATVESAVALLSAQLIVVRTGATAYVALSNVCPHSGCGVSIVLPPRLVCPCHGSEFNFRGERLAGPAPSGLTVLASRYEAATETLVVTRP